MRPRAMDAELLEIIPRDLNFTFELKKQSSCSVQLVNISDYYVAFKIKTTSPKKYSVRPNTGIIHPKSTCDFSVTMQAQRVAPPDLQCKDKFLIQGTVVPSGTAAEAITADMFAKGNGKYIEESKLKVILVSPPQSPILRPINGNLNGDCEASTLRDQVLIGVENLPSLHKVTNDVESPKSSKHAEELKPVKDIVELKQSKDMVELKQSKDMVELKQSTDVEFKLAEDVEELRPAKSMEDFKQTNDVELPSVKDMEPKISNKVELKTAKNVEKLELAKDVEELKLKVKELEAKLSGAETTITMLRQERSTTIEERQTLQQLTISERKNGVRRDQVGFPFLFVCMVALIGITVGYLLNQ